MTREKYPEWLRAQPDEVQDRILGETRAKAFREGTYVIDKYTDPPGRITLDDLARRTPEVPRRKP